jgi:hypothetical protein
LFLELFLCPSFVFLWFPKSCFSKKILVVL